MFATTGEGWPVALDPVAWTFAAGGDYSEQLDWWTDMMSAPTGGTQHRRLRESPRTLLSSYAMESGANRRWMDALLRSNSAGAWWAPVSIDARPLAMAAAVSDDALLVSIDGARFLEGGHVLVVGEDPRRFEVREIDTVDDDFLVLSTGLALAWPAGTQLYPVRRARLAETPSVGRFTADDSDLVPIRFRLEEPLDSEPAIPGETYRGLPVFDFVSPVWTSNPAWVPERLLVTVDNEIAAPVVIDTAGVALGKVAMQYAPDTSAAIAAFRGALFALAGRWSPAWVPSWIHDLRIAAPVSAGAITLDVDGPLLSTSAGAIAPNHRDIRIELHSGAVYYRRITAVAAYSATVDRLTLGSALPAAFTVAQVRMISFITLSVQDADTNLLRYFGPDVAQCEMVWRELSHEL